MLRSLEARIEALERLRRTGELVILRTIVHPNDPCAEVRFASVDGQRYMRDDAESEDKFRDRLKARAGELSRVLHRAVRIVCASHSQDLSSKATHAEIV